MFSALVDETRFKTLPLSDKYKVLPPILCREPISIHIDLAILWLNKLPDKIRKLEMTGFTYYAYL